MKSNWTLADAMEKRINKLEVENKELLRLLEIMLESPVDKSIRQLERDYDTAQTFIELLKENKK